VFILAGMTLTEKIRKELKARKLSLRQVHLATGLQRITIKNFLDGKKECWGSTLEEKSAFASGIVLKSCKPCNFRQLVRQEICYCAANQVSSAGSRSGGAGCWIAGDRCLIASGQGRGSGAMRSTP